MQESQREVFSAALGRVLSGLFVVSARRGDEETSFLASWVVQAGFDPPAVSVGVGRGRPALPFMEGEDARFAVSVIGDDERKKLGPFFKPVGPGPNALAALDVDRTPGGLAVVKDCLAWLECRPVSRGDSGDHVIVIGEVLEAGGRCDAQPAGHVRTNGLEY